MKSRLLALAIAAGLLTTPLAFAQQGKVTKNERRVRVRVLHVDTQKQVRPLETTVGQTTVGAVLRSRMVGLNDSPRVQQFDVNPFDQLGVSVPQMRAPRGVEVPRR
ncbi:MAG: hypothetical protein ABI718_14925 [Acidobacteriota bacterium]